MSEPYLGEIRLLPYNWPPKGWMLCQGQLLSINANAALFSLLGIFYGGDGVTNFKLPDLRGRSIRHLAPGTQLGAVGGQETVTLSLNEMPAHNHFLITAAGGSSTSEFTNALAGAAVTGTDPVNLYADGASPAQALAPGSVGVQGAGLPHDNCQPSLVLNYCIAVNGIYPSRN